MKYNIFKVKITAKCNRNCSFCVFHDGINDMDFDTFKFIIEKSKNIDFDTFHINGGEPLIHPQFIEISNYLKEIYSDKKLVLGTNGILFSKKNIYDCIIKNYDEVCIGCDDEHKNIEYLEKYLPQMIENSNILFIINSINQYTSILIQEKLQLLKEKYPERIILVKNDVHHIADNYKIHKLSKLCNQGGKRVLMIDERGNIYRCFNSKVPDDIEFNIFDKDVLIKINKPRDMHYKYCPYCPLYDDNY